MANLIRGEIAIELDGKPYRACLTLGALAELEARLNAPDMAGIAERFETGRLKAHDAIAILAAGLRGAGHAVTDDDVAAMRADLGAAGYVDMVARLLRATFSADGGGEDSPSRPLDRG